MRSRVLFAIPLTLVLLSYLPKASSFRASGNRLGLRNVGTDGLALNSAVALSGYVPTESWIDFMSKPVNPGPSMKIKGKTLNIWGFMYALITMTMTVAVLPFMFVCATFADLRGNGAVSSCAVVVSSLL